MPTIVHFDIASENPQRAKQFYESLFGWKIEGPPGMPDYYLIQTEAQPTLSVRIVTSVDSLPKEIGNGLRVLLQFTRGSTRK